MRKTLTLLVLVLSACRWQPGQTTPPRAITEEAPTAVTATPFVPKASTSAPIAEQTDDQREVEFSNRSSGTPQMEAFEWPAPPPSKADLSRDSVTSAQQATAEALREQLPPAKDDIALAVAFKGLRGLPLLSSPSVTSSLPVGTSETFIIRNYENNTNARVEAKLLAVGRHAYFWFDTSPGYSQPRVEDLALASEAFDTIYEQVTAYFGPENNPGIDGDPRIHIFNASPSTVCEVEGDSDRCSLLGFVSSRDMVPKAIDHNSNEREMFVMNGQLFGQPSYLGVLAHEFRHMIEANHDTNDIDWEVEGSAMLAADLLGYPDDPLRRANQFLTQPDQQLNRWSDGNTTPHYGQSYLLNLYIFNRLGPELYKDFAMHPSSGFQALDDVSRANGLAFDGESLWLDWLTALAIHEASGAPDRYLLRDGLETAAAETIRVFPYMLNTTVNQYAADYYQLMGTGQVTLSFTGSSHARLMQVLPASGERMWLANRANFSDARLTREVDLTGVSEATLTYKVYFAIEQGYDFGYISVSTDNGRSWQGLVSEHMQGLADVDNPGEIALTERFYTGDSGGWVDEEIDLTPFVGQTILLRFEYVTDPILTFAGLALDNISIQEIGFYDGAETVTAWTAEGFVRATGYVPQEWHLQLITYMDGVPAVQLLELNEDGELELPVTLTISGGGYPLLIVAATAPMTLEPAYYQLVIE